MRDVAGLVFDEIVIRIKSIPLDDRARVDDKTSPVSLGHVEIEGFE